MDETVRLRFWSKVDMSAGPFGCWLWTKARNGCGYGNVWIPPRCQLAHRVSYGLLVGDISPDTELDHLCRNRKCVNPWHLEPISHKENVRRGMAGKHLLARTHCPRGHEYNEANTKVRDLGDGRVGRHCRICLRMHQQNSRARAKQRVVAF